MPAGADRSTASAVRSSSSAAAAAAAADNDDDRTTDDFMIVTYHNLGTAERHEQDMALHRELEAERQRRAEAELARACTFRPNIDHRSSELVEAKRYTRLGNGDVSQRLLERAKIMEVERARAADARQRAEEARMRVEAPFRPRIDAASAHTSRRMFAGHHEPVEERLLEYGRKTKEAQEKRLQLKAEHDRLQQARAFKPRVNSGSSAKSLPTRAQEQHNERLARLAEARAAAEIGNCTFRPSTNQLSARLDAARRAGEVATPDAAASNANGEAHHHRRGGDDGPEGEENGGGGARQHRGTNDKGGAATSPPSDRAGSGGAGEQQPRQRRGRGEELYEAALRQREASERRQREREAASALEHDFRPRVDPRSEMYIRDGRNAEAFRGNFVQRQEDFQALREAARQRAEEQRLRDERAASQLPRGRSGALPMDEEEAALRAERLYAQRKVAERAKKELERELLAEQCTFRPQLSETSKRITKNRVVEQGGQRLSVVERLSTHAVQLQRRRQQAQAQARVRSSSAPHQKIYNNTAHFVSPHRGDGGCSSVDDAGSACDRSTRSAALSPDAAAAFHRRQQEALQRKAAKLRELQAERELEALLPCTFRPRIIDTPPSTSRSQASGAAAAAAAAASASAPNASAAVTAAAATAGSAETGGGPAVSGMDAFVQRQHEARRRAEDERQRREQLGQGSRCNGPGYTIVAPFKLSEGRPSTPTRSGRSSSTTPKRSPREGRAQSAARRAHDTLAGVSFDRLNTSKVPGASKQAQQHVDPFAANKLLDAVKRYTAGVHQSSHTSIFMD